MHTSELPLNSIAYSRMSSNIQFRIFTLLACNFQFIVVAISYLCCFTDQYKQDLENPTLDNSTEGQMLYTVKKQRQVTS